MSLTLTVLTYRNQPPPRTISKTFAGAGGTIGRLEQNDLVLPDPERTISRRHAQVDFRDGAYFITGLGQNPLELNGRAMAPGSLAKLATGDRLVIGEYCIVAELITSVASPAPDVGVLAGTRGLDDFVSDGGGDHKAFGIDLYGGPSSLPPDLDPTGFPSSQQPIMRSGHQTDEVPGVHVPLPPATPVAHIPDDYDLLRGLDAAPAPSQGTPSHAPTPGKGGLLPEDPFGDSPAVAPIPPDWDPTPPRLTPAAPPVSIPVREAIAAPPRQDTRIPEDTQQPVSAPEYAQAVRSLLEAAGVPELTDHALADPNFARNVGELLREAISGLLKALVARALTKRELRVDMTMLSTTENNPLKFSPDGSEALTHLLLNRPRKGYLPPVRAVQEAYDDLQAHNLAVMAGTRAALQEVLQRFDPARLEKRLDTSPLLDRVLPQNRKARMWDLVASQHADLVREAQDEFDRLFGRAFRTAYEEQLRKLRAASGKGVPR